MNGLQRPHGLICGDALNHSHVDYTTICILAWFACTKHKLTLYHAIPSLNDPEIESIIMQMLWEKEKMLLTSIFSFSHNVFYRYPRQKFLSANAFNLDQSKILPFGKELSLGLLIANQGPSDTVLIKIRLHRTCSLILDLQRPIRRYIFIPLQDWGFTLKCKDSFHLFRRIRVNDFNFYESAKIAQFIATSRLFLLMCNIVAD